MTQARRTRLGQIRPAMPVFECPICGQKVSCVSLSDVPCRPFCSLRCQAIDLGRWLTEEYRISEELPHPPADETSPSDERPDVPGPQQDRGSVE